MRIFTLHSFLNYTPRILKRTDIASGSYCSERMIITLTYNAVTFWNNFANLLSLSSHHKGNLPWPLSLLITLVTLVVLAILFTHIIQINLVVLATLFAHITLVTLVILAILFAHIIQINSMVLVTLFARIKPLTLLTLAWPPSLLKLQRQLWKSLFLIHNLNSGGPGHSFCSHCTGNKGGLATVFGHTHNWRKSADLWWAGDWSPW
jgi:hypothetical protein